MSNEAEKKICLEVIEELEEVHANNGCNDYFIPNTPEMVALWKEWNIHNSGATGPEHDQWVPSQVCNFDGTQLLVNDSITTFLLRKQLGLLK